MQMTNLSILCIQSIRCKVKVLRLVESQGIKLLYANGQSKFFYIVNAKRQNNSKKLSFCQRYI